MVRYIIENFVEYEYMKHMFERRMKDLPLLKLRTNCEGLSSIWSFMRNSNICFIYPYSFIHPSRVHYELTIWPAPSWLDSSVGRALHRHRSGHGIAVSLFPHSSFVVCWRLFVISGKILRFVFVTTMISLYRGSTVATFDETSDIPWDLGWVCLSVLEALIIFQTAMGRICYLFQIKCMLNPKPFEL